MGSKTFDGVKFAAYTDDHSPPHVHGFYAEILVIVDLNDGIVALSRRSHPIAPRNAKQSDVNHVLRTAAKYAEQLLELWRVARG